MTMFLIERIGFNNLFRLLRISKKLKLFTLAHYSLPPLMIIILALTATHFHDDQSLIHAIPLVAILPGFNSFVLQPVVRLMASVVRTQPQTAS